MLAHPTLGWEALLVFRRHAINCAEFRVGWGALGWFGLSRSPIYCAFDDVLSRWRQCGCECMRGWGSGVTRGRCFPACEPVDWKMDYYTDWGTTQKFDCLFVRSRTRIGWVN